MSELDTSVNELNDEIITFKTQLDKVQSLMENFKKKCQYSTVNISYFINS